MKDANFFHATFTQSADFGEATFAANTHFVKATFAQAASFCNACFESSEPKFARENLRARFSAQADPQDYLFEAHPESPHGFSFGTAELLNRTFILPLGAVLYDPDSWDEEKQDYTRFSEPAQ